MKKLYQFVLPWPPTLNKYRACVNGRLITSREGRLYTDDVCYFLRKNGLNKVNLSVPVWIDLILHPKANYRYDVSNFLKAYEDSLVIGGFLSDDHLIRYKGINKGEKRAGGQLDLTFYIDENLTIE